MSTRTILDPTGERSLAERARLARPASLRGVTVGPIENGLHSDRGYGTAACARTMNELARLGATWVSLHHGGGVGMGFSQHAGMVIVADGTDNAARRLQRVLWNDPATGVMRHADAGYEDAIACAREKGLDLPSLDRG